MASGPNRPNGMMKMGTKVDQDNLMDENSGVLNSACSDPCDCWCWEDAVAALATPNLLFRLSVRATEVPALIVMSTGFGNVICATKSKNVSDISQRFHCVFCMSSPSRVPLLGAYQKGIEYHVLITCHSASQKWQHLNQGPDLNEIRYGWPRLN
jgi:hypothetical protein